MKKHIEYIIKTNFSKLIDVTIVEQSHRGFQFGNDGTCRFSVPVILDKEYILLSEFFPGLDQDTFEKRHVFHVRGNTHQFDNIAISMTPVQFVIWKTLVKKYNDFFRK